MKYVGKTIWEYGNNILIAWEEQDDDYVLKTYEIELSKEMYETLIQNRLQQYYIIKNVKIISSMDELQSTADHNKSLLKVATFNFNNNKKWITGLKLEEPQYVTTDAFLLTDDDIYFYLSSFDLSRGNLFFVNADVTQITRNNLRKALPATMKASADIKEDPKIAELKSYYSENAKKGFISRIDPEIVLNFVMLSISRDKLASKGYIITEENKEEQYKEIAASGDVELLQHLSRYLFFMEKVQPYIYLYNLYSSFIKDLSVSTTEADIEKAWNIYLGEILGYTVI